jgi:hypothetical protein
VWRFATALLLYFHFSSDQIAGGSNSERPIKLRAAACAIGGQKPLVNLIGRV